jgi:uncharacterized iron-regulated membrane protein
VTAGERRSAWQRWVRQPQTLWLRRAFFQVHLWSGIALGLYIFFISVTGSVLVYRNELYVAATPEPGSAAPTDAPSTGIWLVSTLIELHDDLLAGPAGRKVNGIGAIAVVVVALTGLVLWWPGVRRWRRSLRLRRDVGWKRFVWDLHSAIGIWSFAFVLIFGLSGIYLCFPETLHALADRLEPMTMANAGRRFVDGVLYWLAFLHFGRINGIGIPCDGPGLCDQLVKATWAVFGLAPAAMFVTGAIMWWNRVLRPWRVRSARARMPYTRTESA